MCQIKTWQTEKQFSTFGSSRKMDFTWASEYILWLDGSFTGSPKIFEIVKKIAAEFSSNKIIQIGGGIRNLKAIDDYVELGVSKIVLGTAAINNPSFLKSMPTVSWLYCFRN